MRVGFVAGDAELVRYLGETRKHAGLIVPDADPGRGARRRSATTSTSYAQRDRYERRRELDARRARARTGLVHDGGPALFYLWLRAAESADDGWEIAARLAEAGTLVAPGSLYGPAGRRPRAPRAHPARRPPRARARSGSPSRPAAREPAPPGPRRRRPCPTSRQQITELWEHRDDIAAVMPEAEAAVHVREAIDLLDTGQARVAEVVDDEIVVHQWLKQAILLLFRLTQHERDRARARSSSGTRSR